MQKTCTNCKVTKDSTDFYKDRSTKDYLTRSCKECMSNYRHANKDKNKELARKYRLENPEKVRATNRRAHFNKDVAKRIMQQIVHRAKTRNIELSISENDIVVPNICPYLKVPFVKGTKGNYQYTYSIDRIDNSKGYIPGNIEIISMKANSMKNNATDAELLNFALEVIRRNIDKDIVRTMLKSIEV